MDGEAMVGTSLPMPSYEERLTHDLERLLRYALTAKEVDVPKDLLEDATKAVQASKSVLSECAVLTPDIELALFRCVDALTPRVYPATIASLEIAELMETGSTGGSVRQQQIRQRVKRLISTWIWATIAALMLVFATSALETLDLGAYPLVGSWGKPLSTAANPIVLGFLGACAYILRNILQGLANQTFVLREGTNYTLRSILGIVLGFMMPALLPTNPDGNGFGPLSLIAIPFLAGYAVEPMFAALDNLVLTIRDAVSRGPASAAVRAR